MVGEAEVVMKGTGGEQVKDQFEKAAKGADDLAKETASTTKELSKAERELQKYVKGVGDAAKGERAYAQLMKQKKAAIQEQLKLDWGKKQAAEQAELNRSLAITKGWQDRYADAQFVMKNRIRATTEEVTKQRHGIEQLGSRGGSALSSLSSGMMRYITAAGGMIGGAAAVFSSVQSFQEGIQRRRQFESELTPLVSLGDNVSNQGAIRKSVLDRSGAWGMPTSEMARFDYGTGSGTAGLDDETIKKLQKGALVTAKVTGDPLGIINEAGISTWRIFGQEIGNVDVMWGKLNKTAEDGKLTMEQFASFAPDLENAGKALGMTFDEVMASISATTNSAGSPEKALTGLRTVYAAMTDAGEKGFDFKGTLGQKIEQIGKMTTEEKLAVFGREGIASAQALYTSRGDYAQAMQTLGGIKGNYVEGKMFKKFADPIARAADTASSIEEAQKNVTLGGGGWDTFNQKYELGKLGYMTKSPAFLHWLAPAASLAEIGTKLLMPWTDTTYINAGQEEMQRQYVAGGRPEMAGAMLMPDAAANRMMEQRAKAAGYTGGEETSTAQNSAAVNSNTAAVNRLTSTLQNMTARRGPAPLAYGGGVRGE